MTPYASIALYKRDGAIVFRPARKEQPTDRTHVRKAAFRHWNRLAKGDHLVKVIVAREFAGRLEVAERASADRAWREFSTDMTTTEPHMIALLKELGIDQDAIEPTMPDILVINGVTYRRDI